MNFSDFPVCIKISNILKKGKKYNAQGEPIEHRHAPMLDLKLGDKLIKRLRSFGFENIYCVGFLRKPPTYNSSTFAKDKKKFKEIKSKLNIPGTILPFNSKKDSLTEWNISLWNHLLEKLSLTKTNFLLYVNTRALFTTKKELHKLLHPPSRNHVKTILSGKQSRGWLKGEKATVLKKKFLEVGVKNGEPPPPTRYYSLPANSTTPLPKELRNNFEFIPAYKKVFKELSDIPAGKWSRKKLVELFKNKPHIFRGLPSHLGIELTNNNNLPKRKKLSSFSSRPVTYLSKEDWVNVLASAKNLNKQQAVFSIDFWNYGEPLLHDQCIDFINMATQEGIRVDLYTNGKLLNKETSQKLIHSGLDTLFIHLDNTAPGFYPENLDQIMENIPSNLQTFLELKKEHNDLDCLPWKPTVAAVITMQENTPKKATSFLDKFNNLNQIRKNFEKNNQSIGRNKCILFTELYKNHPPIEYGVIKEANTFCGKLTNEKIDYSPLRRKPCTQLFDGLFLLSTGKYVICREDIGGMEVIGNANEDIEQLWNNNKMNKLLNMHQNENWDEHPLCNKCKDWYKAFR